MEPLQLNREQLAFFSASISSCKMSWNLKIFRRFKLTTLYFLQVSACVCCIVFMIKHMKTDLCSALYAVYQLSAVMISVISMALTSIFPKLVRNYFEMFENIRKNGK